MEHWLVCFAAALPAARRAEIIRGAGASLANSADGVPMGDEVSVEVDAGADAISTLRAHPEVRGIYPNSELTLY